MSVSSQGLFLAFNGHFRWLNFKTICQNESY